MKKILVFSLAYYPHHVSGAEAAIKEITDRIDDIEFHMITLRWGNDHREESIGNVTVYRVGFGGAYISKILFPLLAAFTARRLHHKHHFDALWAMMTYMLLPVVLAKMLGVRAPHILTLQDGDPYDKVFGRLRIIPLLPFIDRGFRTATIVQAISKYLAEWPGKRGSYAPVVVIHNGANPRDISGAYSSSDVEALKRKFGKNAGDIFLINTARLEHQKGNDVTIRALKLLPEHVKLLLIGDGSEEKMLKELAMEFGLKERVMFAGRVDRDQVTAYRKAADIFVAPSRSEGLGNAFLSAMASELPVVATQEGGLAEFVFDDDDREQKTAWVVAKDSPEDIASAVKDILAHPEVVREVTKRAREMVIRKYDWDSVAKEMRERIFARVQESSLIDRARKIAQKEHALQVRKSDGSPYIEHPRAVAEILTRYHFPEQLIAAAWVHDVVEDTELSLEDIRKDLGDEVATIVSAVTEDKTLEWEERKRRYIETVRRGSNDAKAVATADKVHNLSSIIEMFAQQGNDLWQKFNRGKKKKLWFEEEMLKMLKETWQHPLVDEYEKLVKKMRGLD